MPRYTVRDTQTNKKVTFQWNDANPPTDSDFEEVFSSAGLREEKKATQSAEKKQLFKQVDPKQNPVLGTTQDVLTQGSGAFLNQALLNAPEFALKKAGVEFPQPTTTAGKTARIGGGLLGFAAGLPGKIGLKTVSGTAKGIGYLGKKFGKPMLEKVAEKLPQLGTATKATIGGTATGLATTPEAEKGGFVNLPERAKTGAIYGLTAGIPTKMATTTATAIKGVVNYLRPVKFANKVRAQFVAAKQKAVDKFGKELGVLTENNPDKSVDLRGTIKSLQDDIEQSLQDPSIRSAIKKVPKLQNMIDNPELAANVSLKDSQEIINGLTSKISQAKLKGQNVRSSDIPLFDFIHEVKGSQLEAFPEMAPVRAEYGKVLNNYNLVKNKIKQGQLLQNIKTKFGDPEIEDAVKKLVPKKVINEMGGYRNVTKAVRAALVVGSIGVVGGAGAYIGRKIFHGSKTGQ